MFIKARKHATIGYLNLCIALQRIKLARTADKLVDMESRIEQLDLTIGRFLNIGSETYALQVNGDFMGHALPITCLEGEIIRHVVIVPGKIINLITK